VGGLAWRAGSLPHLYNGPLLSWPANLNHGRRTVRLGSKAGNGFLGSLVSFILSQAVCFQIGVMIGLHRIN